LAKFFIQRPSESVARLDFAVGNSLAAMGRMSFKHRAQIALISMWGVAVMLEQSLLLAANSKFSKKPAATISTEVSTPPGLDLISRADPNQASATAGALMVPQVNQRAFSDD